MSNKLFKRSNLPYLLVGLVVLGFVMSRVAEQFDDKDKKAAEKSPEKPPVDTTAAPALSVTAPSHTPGLFERIWNYFFGYDAPAPAAVTPAATSSTPAASSTH
jgi:hypothetical protein